MPLDEDLYNEVIHNGEIAFKKLESLVLKVEIEKFMESKAKGDASNALDEQQLKVIVAELESIKSGLVAFNKRYEESGILLRSDLFLADSLLHSVTDVCFEDLVALSYPKVDLADYPVGKRVKCQIVHVSDAEEALVWILDVESVCYKDVLLALDKAQDLEGIKLPPEKGVFGLLAEQFLLRGVLLNDLKEAALRIFLVDLGEVVEVGANEANFVQLPSNLREMAALAIPARIVAFPGVLNQLLFLDSLMSQVEIKILDFCVVSVHNGVLQIVLDPPKMPQNPFVDSSDSSDDNFDEILDEFFYSDDDTRPKPGDEFNLLTIPSSISTTDRIEFNAYPLRPFDQSCELFQLCLARYPKNKHLYPARVTRLCPNAELKVLFHDTDDETAVVPQWDIYQPQTDEQHAFRFRLAGVRVSELRPAEEVKMCLVDMLREVRARVTRIVEKDVFEAEVFTEDGTNVAMLLMEGEYAEADTQP